MRKAMLLALGTLGGALCIAGPAGAQESEIDKVYACAGIAEPDTRLACFDAAVATMKQAQTSGEVTVVSRAQAVQAEKDAFGLSPAQAGPKTTAVPAAADAEVDRISVTIVAREKRQDGKFRFTLDNGQMWEQTDTTRLGPMPDGVLQGEIRRAALGSFMLKLDGPRAFRVKRVK